MSLRDAAQQALEALEEYQAKGAPFWACDAAVAALRAALAEPQPEIEQLKAERDALKAAAEKGTEYVLAQINQDLRAERDALRADAERYRWLRDMDEDPVMSLAAQYTDCNGSAISISMRIDAAIDAAKGDK